MKHPFTFGTQTPVKNSMVFHTAFKINYLRMKTYRIILIILCAIPFYQCTKEESTERFDLLTGPVWLTDSLLADGLDAGGVGGLLEKFRGEAKFDKDGTGSFGVYKGTWELAYDDTELIITTDSLPIPLSAKIAELTSLSLKITTAFPNRIDPENPVDIRMTFKSK